MRFVRRATGRAVDRCERCAAVTGFALAGLEWDRTEIRAAADGRSA